MNLESQVCSLDLAKRLKELGVKQESIFRYDVWQERATLRYFTEEPIISGEIPYAAFTSTELGEMLPDCIRADKLFNNGNTTLMDLNGHFIKSSKKDDEYKIYIDGLTKITIFFSKNEANARANMLIHLIENKLITIEEINNG